jgi:hypothetical protein
MGPLRPSPFEDRSQTQHISGASRHPAIPNLMTTPDSTPYDGVTPRSVIASELASLQSQQNGAGIFDMDDMALWHHFIKSTAATLSNRWGEELPQLALNCDYLLHAILAVAALHIAYLHPDGQDKYSQLANHHQDLAFPAMNRVMANVTPENANQLFAASTLVLVFSFASFKSPEHLFPFTESPNIEGVSNWMLCLRGCSKVVQAAQAHIEEGPLGFLLPQDRVLEHSMSLGAVPNTEDEESLKQISEIVLNLPSIKSSTMVEEMDAYHDAIQKLRILLVGVAQGLETTMRRTVTSMWPAVVTDIYIRLLAEKRPPALIIMAHYCSLLTNMNDCWYFEHRGRHLFQSIQEELDEEWASYIKHPYRIITGKF